MANDPSNKIFDTSDSNFSYQVNDTFNDIEVSLSKKESGQYSSLESSAGITIFPEEAGGKQVKRKYFSIGALPNAAGTSATVHGLTFTRITRVYGMANDSSANLHLPIPYATATAADILELNVDSTNINIVVGKDMSSYNAYVCVEYLLT